MKATLFLVVGCLILVGCKTTEELKRERYAVCDSWASSDDLPLDCLEHLKHKAKVKAEADAEVIAALEADKKLRELEAANPYGACLTRAGLEHDKCLGSGTLDASACRGRFDVAQLVCGANFKRQETASTQEK